MSQIISFRFVASSRLTTPDQNWEIFFGIILNTPPCHVQMELIFTRINSPFLIYIICILLSILMWHSSVRSYRPATSNYILWVINIKMPQCAWHFVQLFFCHIVAWSSWKRHQEWIQFNFCFLLQPVPCHWSAISSLTINIHIIRIVESFGRTADQLIVSCVIRIAHTYAPNCACWIVFDASSRVHHRRLCSCALEKLISIMCFVQNWNHNLMLI